MNLKVSSPVVLLLAFIATILFFASQATGAPIQSTEFQIEIDRSAVPVLNSYDLTLIINVSNAQSISTTDGSGNPISYTAGPAADEITVTTDKTEINVALADLIDTDDLGTIRKADLKDNYLWAYSHGFDDNYFLEEETGVFLSRNIPAGFNIVTDWITDPVDAFGGDFQYWEFKRLVDAGWDINNHTVDHEAGCGAGYDRADRKADVLRAQNQLRDLLAGTTRPDYKVLGFTIPCGFADQIRDYPGVINEIRNNGEDTILYTDGVFNLPIHMDVSPPYDIETVVIRDGRIDGSGANTPFITGQLDQISTLAGEQGKPLWYTTFSHGDHLFGDNTQVLAESLDYLIGTYGTGGTNEVWIAPTSTVISYLQVRDLSVIRKDGALLPTPTPTQAPTAIPAACNELDNPGFESGTASWQSLGTLETVSGRSGTGLQVSNGYTQQNIPVEQLGEFLLQGYVKTDAPATAGWNGVGIDYLNSSGAEIGDKSMQIFPTNNQFVEFQITGTPPAGTTSVNVWLFSGGPNANLIFDDLALAWQGCDPGSPTSTPTAEPNPTEVPPAEGTATPSPVGTLPPVDLSVFIYLPIHTR